MNSQLNVCLMGVKNLQLDWSLWGWSLYTQKCAGVESNVLFSIHNVVHMFCLISRRFRKSVFLDSVLQLWQVQKSGCTQIWSTLAYTSCLSHPPNYSLTWQDAAAISRPVTPVPSITDFWIWLLQTEKILTELHGTSAPTLNMAMGLRLPKTFSYASFCYEVIRVKFHNLRLRLSANQCSHTRIQLVAQSVKQMIRVTVCQADMRYLS
jgi:hypothetical protein